MRWLYNQKDGNELGNDISICEWKTPPFALIKKKKTKRLSPYFRLYIKSMGEDTICRVEETKHPKKPAIEFIHDVFNPTERLERLILGQHEKNL